MSRRIQLAVAGLVAAALIAAFFLLHAADPPAEAPAENRSAAAAGGPVAAGPAQTPHATDSDARFAAIPMARARPGAGAGDPGSSAPQAAVPDLEDVKGSMFRTDASGRLVTDEQARLNIEKLFALNDPRELQIRLQELSRELPPAAAQGLADLVDRYRNYDAALRQTVRSDQAPASEEDALTLLETMHALRVQYFGPEVAEGFFGAEEKMQRELIELMRLQADQSLTLQEKAEKAQALYGSSPEIRARREAGRAERIDSAR